MFSKLYDTLSNLGHPRICVIGDMMLDTYVWGSVSRVSPEGPVPVLKVDRREHRPGGAGSLAAMLCALEAKVSCVGVVGEDQAGEELRRELGACGADTSGLVSCHGRPTTLKMRYLGYVQSAGRALQQMLRVDEESTDSIAAEAGEAVLDRLRALSKDAQGIVIQDMAKGLFNQGLMQKIIFEASASGKLVIVDPERGENYSRYAGASYLLPNRYEAETATGIKLDGEDAYRKAGRWLLKELALKAAVIKLDRDGIFYTSADGEGKHITTHARDVADVTGAGDMVAAVLSLMTAGGACLEEAVELANVAAGIEVTRHGAAAISRAELLEELQANLDPSARKIKTRHDLRVILAHRRSRGEKIAFTNGCFDLLHLGHLELMRHARAQGDCLVVAINSDRSVHELKGPGRPVNTQDVRARMLAGLADVDYVVIFDEVSVLPLIKELAVELRESFVLVKGGDYDRDGVVGHEVVEASGGQVKLAPLVKGLSTTELIRRISRNNER